MRTGIDILNHRVLTGGIKVERSYDYSPDVIICLIGANDTGSSGTVGTFGMTSEPIVSEVSATTTYTGTYFIQAISYIMQHIKLKKILKKLKTSKILQEKESKERFIPKLFCLEMKKK